MGNLDLSRPDDQKTRAELVLSNVRRAWSTQTSGVRYFEAVLDFLKSLQNDNSKRTYVYSVLEFLEWLRITKSYLPTLDQVTRSDAAAYASYLSRRDKGLEREWLAQDQDRAFDLAIYDLVAANPGIRINALSELLVRRYPQYATDVRVESGGESRTARMLLIDAEAQRTGAGGGFPEHLGCLVHTRTLRREPSIADIRAGKHNDELGLTPQQAQQAGVKINIAPGIFRYYVVERSSRDVERAGTVATRVVVLSALWDHLTQAGENRPGAEALLRYNIWKDVLGRVAEQSRAQAAVTRGAKTPTDEIQYQLLGTTFRRAFGQEANAAARSFFAGQLDNIGTASLRDLRDRFALLLLMQLGLRRSELGKLARRDLEITSPDEQGRQNVFLTVTGKRGKQRQIAMPRPTYVALAHLYERIGELARRSERMTKLLEPGAPLVPVIYMWGANANEPATEGLSPAGVAQMLRRRAREAGYREGTPEWKRVHAHGFRHLFAQDAKDAGTEGFALQAILGHASPQTTGIYAEERRPERRIAKQFEEAPALPRLQPLAPPVPRVPEPKAALGRAPKPAAPKALTDQKRERIDEKNTRLLVSRPTGRVWWTGPSGRLKPEMPVMSPMQAGECDTSSVCGKLAELWRRWASEKGPTATAALTAWVADALEVSRVADVAIVKRGLEAPEELEARDFIELKLETRSHWVAPDAPLEVTQLDKDAYREHQPAAIVGWFEQVAYQYRTRPSAEGETGEREVLTPETIPAWYSESDPLASMPYDDRTALLGWLVALQGKQPPLTGKRGDAQQVLEQLCKYEEVRDSFEEGKRAALADASVDLSILQAPLERLRAIAQDPRSRATARHLAEQEIGRRQSAELVDGIVRRYSPTFSVERAMQQRVQQVRAAKAAGTKGMGRAAFYLSLVRDMFGDEIAADETVQVLARCSELRRKGVREVDKYPLSDDENSAFFNVDWNRGTIVHSPEFARTFAKKFRQHSECVARRIARELWELKATGKLATKDIVPVVESMRAFRVPCSEDQETELRSRLDDWSEPLIFFHRWAAQFKEARREAAKGFSGKESETLRGAMDWARQWEEARPTRRTAAHEESLARGFRANARTFRFNPIVALAMVYA